MATTTRGKLIVIEGGDAAGKATQAALLTNALMSEGVAVSQLNFPQYEHNHVGKLLRECLDGKRGNFMAIDPKVIAVLYSVDRYESKRQLQTWLEEGRTVLLDRYVSANLLHQGAKVPEPEERLETMRWIHKLEHVILGLPEPDAIFTLDVPAAVRAELRQQQSRSKGRLIDVADQDRLHQQQVDTALKDLPRVYDCVVPVEAMDGEELRAPEHIAAEIFSATRAILEK